MSNHSTPGNMSGMTFDEFFKTATTHQPFDYQRRLACGKRDGRDKSSWLSGGTSCESKLINIPTGCGKTAAVVLAWLWNRIFVPSLNAQPSTLNYSPWPRRLVYCLPMRTLVEQTRDNVRKWLKNLDDLEWNRTDSHDGKVGLHISMGGEERESNPWDLYPEHNAILIGTQDMLLSRALNRGYGMGRARWPMHFGLLNNDCVWVLDEVQLMSSGLTTSLQLQAWRDRLTLRCGTCVQTEAMSKPTLLPTFSWWMSATAAEHWFKKSVAMRDVVGSLWKNRVRCDPKTDARAAELFSIPKTLTRCCQIRLQKLPEERERRTDAINCYAHAVAQHLAKAGSRRGKKKAADREEISDVLTLVICNVVERATAVYRALAGCKDGATRIFDDQHLLLLHSRFRPYERKDWPAKLKAFEEGTGPYSGPRIIVTTQVIEAGSDISAPIIYTELCPLAPLIQRLGRCGRRKGEEGKAYWIDFESFKDSGTDELSDDSKRTARPYHPREIAAARQALTTAEAAAKAAASFSSSSEAAKTSAGEP